MLKSGNGYSVSGSKLIQPFPVEVIVVNTPKEYYTPDIKSPGAFGEIEFELPQGYLYQIMTFSFKLNTDATPATRIPDFLVTQGRLTRLMSRASGGSTASQIGMYYQYGIFGVRNGTSGETIHEMNLPEHVLQGGCTIQTTSTGLQAGDIYYDISLMAKRWLA